MYLFYIFPSYEKILFLERTPEIISDKLNLLSN